MSVISQTIAAAEAQAALATGVLRPDLHRMLSDAARGLSHDPSALHMVVRAIREGRVERADPAREANAAARAARPFWEV